MIVVEVEEADPLGTNQLHNQSSFKDQSKGVKTLTKPAGDNNLEIYLIIN